MPDRPLLTQYIESGQFAELDGGEAKVLCSLIKHANRRTLLAWPGPDTIADDVGRDVRNVRRALRRLEDKGLIKLQVKGGGRTKSNVYHMTIKEGACAPLFDGQKGGVGAQKGGPMRTKRGAHAPPEQCRTVDEQQQGPAAAAGAPPDQQTRQALAAAGIGEPTRSKLASTRGVTPALIRSVTESAQGAGPGLIVTRIREQADASAEAARQRDEAQAALDWWAGLSDEQRAAEREAKRAETPNLRHQPDDAAEWPHWCYRRHRKAGRDPAAADGSLGTLAAQNA